MERLKSALDTEIRSPLAIRKMNFRSRIGGGHYEPLIVS